MGGRKKKRMKRKADTQEDSSDLAPLLKKRKLDDRDLCLICGNKSDNRTTYSTFIICDGNCRKTFEDKYLSKCNECNKITECEYQSCSRYPITCEESDTTHKRVLCIDCNMKHHGCIICKKEYGEFNGVGDICSFYLQQILNEKPDRKSVV